MLRKNKNVNIIKIFLSVFFAIVVILPLTIMLSHIKDINAFELLGSAIFRSALFNSLLLGVCATLISVTLSTALAFAVVRSNIKHKAAFSVILTLPMLIPSISHGMGLVLLLGQNGILTNLFGLTGSIYGFGGVLLGSVMYSFPIAFLMVVDVLKYEDCTPYDAARVLGIPKKNIFARITMPYLYKPLISIVFATFTLVFTDYGVPLMVGGKFTTLPVVMYQEVIGLLNFGKGSVIGAVLLIPALIAFAIDILNKDKGNKSFVTMQATLSKNKTRDALCYVFCILVSAFVILPLLAFCMLSFVKKYPIDISFSLDNIAKAFDMNAGKFLLNSAIIALAVSVGGTIFSFVTAYISSRTKGKTSKLLHLTAITSMAIPGLVLGLSYALTFNKSVIYGTIFLLILVNLIHFFSSPYLLAYNSFGKINANLEAVGLTLGINRMYMIKDVFIPQMWDTILEMFSYFFVNCMMTISAVSFLFSTSNMPLSLMITQFEAQRLLECSAFVSVIILIVNLAIKACIHLIKKRIQLAQEGV